MTVLAQLVAKEEDGLGYVTYVFATLDPEVYTQTKYIMCTRFPNWEHRSIDIDEIGYLSFLEITAGVTTWWDGSHMIPYKYNNIQFLKFVKKPEPKKYKYQI
jgi:hypothetical protein